MLPRKTYILAGLLVLFCYVEIAAEVAVRTNRLGHYLGYQVIAGGRLFEDCVWSIRDRGGRGHNALNPGGDANGDLWPTIVESNQAPHYPWVVWSRFNGTDYDLAWSRWTTAGWDPIRWVEERAAVGDDLDPDLRFDDFGRPYLVWWRAEGDSGEVYFSIFLETRWMEGLRVSAPGVDARYPVISDVQDGHVYVEYPTSTGVVRKILVINDAQTITDDINPQININDRPTVLEPR